MKLKKGDKVIILQGKDAGKTGSIERIYIKKQKVLITGLNIYKRHMKRRDEKTPGGIVDISRPLPIANVALICPKTKLKTRVGYTFIKGTKKRITRKGDAIL